MGLLVVQNIETREHFSTPITLCFRLTNEVLLFRLFPFRFLLYLYNEMIWNNIAILIERSIWLISNTQFLHLYYITLLSKEEHKDGYALSKSKRFHFCLHDFSIFLKMTQKSGHSSIVWRFGSLEVVMATLFCWSSQAARHVLCNIFKLTD